MKLGPLDFNSGEYGIVVYINNDYSLRILKMMRLSITQWILMNCQTEEFIPALQSYH